MTAHALVLNKDYNPLKVVHWQKAIAKVVSGKMELIESYEGRFIRTPTTEFPLPAVVRIVDSWARPRVKLSRKHVLERDHYTCQYCGARPKTNTGRPDTSKLTLDHVVPRAQARKGQVTLPWSGKRVSLTSWWNVVAACERCNFEKADRTPAEARVRLNEYPKPPSMMDIARMSISRHPVQDEWRDYIEHCPWAGYWDVELED